MTVAVEVDAVGFTRYGSPEVLQPLRIVVSPPGPGQVRVRVAAAGVNPADTYLRAGRFRFLLPVRLPFVPGLDIAGVVDDVGPGVSRFAVGQPVYAALPARSGGGYAQLVLVHQHLLAPAPSTLTLAESAALPVAALTALHGLRDHGHLTAGASVLIWGASGAVGTNAVQVARILGGSVTAVTRATARDLADKLGAREVLSRDTAAASLSGRRFDVVFDASGTSSAGRLRGLATTRGRCVTVNPGRGNPAVKVLTQLLPGPSVHGFVSRPESVDLEILRQWTQAGQLRPVVQQRIPLHEAQQAHENLEARTVIGKVVLIVDHQLAEQMPPNL